MKWVEPRKGIIDINGKEYPVRYDNCPKDDSINEAIGILDPDWGGECGTIIIIGAEGQSDVESVISKAISAKVPVKPMEVIFEEYGWEHDEEWRSILNRLELPGSWDEARKEKYIEKRKLGYYKDNKQKFQS